VTPDEEASRIGQECYATWTTYRSARKSADRAAAAQATGATLRAASAGATRAGRLPRPRILASADLDAASVEALAELGELEYASYRDAHRMLKGESLVEALRGFEVFVTEIDLLDGASLAALPDLRAVFSCRGDAVNVDARACSLYGIPVLNAPGRNRDAVADLAVAFLLMLSRKLPDATAYLRANAHEPGDLGTMGRAFGTLRGRELWGRTIGLVGLGAVGRAVAQRLSGFGARLLVSDPFVDDETASRVDAEAVSLDELLAASDLVSLHAAVTDQTRGLLDAAAFARMKAGSALVNTARAALVDEEALASALTQGHLSGAALDVFSVEPPGSDHPLLALPQVIATPHAAGNTFEVSAHQGAIACRELERLVRGERPQHCLNPEVLDSFSWDGPRRSPSAAELASLEGDAGPAVSDLQREKKRAG
jgi:autoinducer 2 (AI-2) kinase